MQPFIYVIAENVNNKLCSTLSGMVSTAQTQGDQMIQAIGNLTDAINKRNTQ